MILKNHSLLSSRKWCLIVFEGRNKSYGAYQLRKNAAERYRYAIFGMIIFTIFVVVFILLTNALYTQKSIYTDNLNLSNTVEWRSFKALPTTTEVHDVPTDRPKKKAPKEITEGETLSDKWKITADTAILSPSPTSTGCVTEKADTASSTTLPTEADIEEPTDNNNPNNLLRETTIKTMPSFPGGWKALIHFLNKNIYYPRQFRKRKVEGKVEVSFIVDSLGLIRNIKLSKTLRPDCDSIVVRACRNMPQWIPAEVEGIPQNVKITIPIYFKGE